MSAEHYLPLAVALITGPALGVLVNYLLGRRKANLDDKIRSGTVSSSEATELWAQTRTLIDEYKASRQDEREMREKLEQRLEVTNKKLFEVMDELAKLQESNSSLKISNAELMRKIDDLKRLMAKLTRENEKLLKLKTLGDDDGQA